MRQKNKALFREEFQKGELFSMWKGIYDGNAYWSDWARHRLSVILKIIDQYRLGRNGAAMDMGIGSGVLMKELSKRGCQVFGADHSYSMVREFGKTVRGEDQNLSGRLIVADVEEIPLKNDGLDLITCIGVLEYVEDDPTSLSEIYRILKPGGYLLLVVASYHRLGAFRGLLKKRFLRVFAKKRKPSSAESSLEYQVRMVKPTDLKSNAAKTGFEIVKFICFGGKVWGRYFPIRLYIPGLLYVGDHCLLLLKKPI